ncbi:MAG TPA: diacylglycerol kinase [Anaeromyxobacter sp.]|nr:diacylglycerol kinase [Anaeromyxobacter sp.]
MERPRPALPEEPAPPQPGAQRHGPRHSLGQSFGWAWAGLAGAAVRERNMRIHLALGILASAAASLLPVAGGERALLLLAVALVVAGEAANSALEAVVDLVSPHWNVRARVAKDAAAGAVLALAGGSVVILVAIALPALHRVDAWARLGAGAAGAVLAAGAAWFLPRHGRRPPAVDHAVLAVGLSGLALVAWAADGIAGVAAAALLLAVAAGGAVRRRRDSERGT